MADLRTVIDAFDRVVAAAAPLVPPADLERAGEVAARARARRGFLGESVAVAFAGGTGSGKSSLVNALAGEEVAPTGALRPTTDTPLAWIPEDPEPGLVRLLDRMGIDERVGHEGLEWLAVIDLPDVDSVETSHRATVERLLPEVDAVVWVMDPEKYQDKVLHHDHIRPLAPYAAQLRFVLNQIDRVPSHQVEALLDDLAVTLREDGIPEPVVVATAADPPFGPPEGMDELVAALRALGEAKRVVTDKILTDLDRTVAQLAGAAGVVGGGATGFAGRWEEVSVEAAGEVAGDLVGPSVVRGARTLGRRAGRQAVSLLGRSSPPAEAPLLIEAAGETGGARRAVDRLERFLQGLAEGVGRETASSLRQVAAGLDREVREAATTVAAGAALPLGEPPSWWGAAAWVRRIAALAALVLVVWLVVEGTGEDVLARLALVAVLGAAVAALSWTAARSGGAWAEAAVRDHRGEIEAVVSRELDRRLGRPLRAGLRERAQLVAALTEYSLERARLQGREIPA